MYTLQTELPSLKNSTIKLRETNDLTDNQKNQFEELQRENSRLKRERRSKYLDFVLIRYIFVFICSYSKET
jgi:FtsZ-binding cell division protein ZapB